MLPISIKFQAYIPRSLGKPLLSYFQNHSKFNQLSNKEEFIRKINSIKSNKVTWLPEPGNTISNYYFSTDNADFHDHHSEHTTRLGLHAKIKPEKIGYYGLIDNIFNHPNHKNWKGHHHQHSGESHRIEAYIKRIPKGYIDTGTAFMESGEYEYVGICDDSTKPMRSDEEPLKISIKNSLSQSYFHSTGSSINNDTTTIKVSASAGYPFAEPLSPNIDFELTIKLVKNLGGKTIDVNVSGWHNDFPAYELIIGERVAYKHNPSDHGYTGPGFSNLTKSRDFSATEWIRLNDSKIKAFGQKNQYGW